MGLVLNWNVVWDNFPTIWAAALVTIGISFVAIVAGLVLGAGVATVRMSHIRLLRFIVIAYVEVFRATPLLVQLYVIYFALARYVKLDNMTSGLVGLTLYTTAYCSEILRAGLESVPAGQQLAGRSLGFTGWQIFRYVTLAQALKNIGPPLTNQFIDTTLSSSVVSVIGGVELTQTATILVAQTFHPFEIYAAVAGVYLVVTFLLANLFGHIGAIVRAPRRLTLILLGRKTARQAFPPSLGGVGR